MFITNKNLNCINCVNIEIMNLTKSERCMLVLQTIDVLYKNECTYEKKNEDVKTWNAWTLYNAQNK